MYDAGTIYAAVADQLALIPPDQWILLAITASTGVLVGLLRDAMRIRRRSRRIASTTRANAIFRN